jgi:hypothetical protein
LERRVIIDGCVALAESIPPGQVEEEILSQCWEQVSERNLLIFFH